MESKATIMKPADRCAEKSGDTKLKNGCLRTECVKIVVIELGEEGGGKKRMTSAIRDCRHPVLLWTILLSGP